MSVVFESEVPDGIVSVGGYRSTVEELLDLPRGPAWQADALCKEYPNLAWFGKSDRSSKATKAVCSACLVRDECLTYAMADPNLDGTWGGLTHKERNQLRHTAPNPHDRLTASA